MFSKTDIEKYFSAEKSFSGLFIILGAVTVIVAVILFFAGKTNWYKGAAIPLVLIGIIQLIASANVYKRSDGDRQRLVYAYDMNPSALKNTELPRMEKVEKTFTIIQIAEVILLLAGLVLYFYFKKYPDQSFWVGFGLMLAIEAALMFGADTFAHGNAKKYTKGLQEFSSKP